MIVTSHHRPVNNRDRGFSLLELSIVLLLIALVAGMGLSSGKSVLDSSKVTSTNNRLAAIETALTAYRQANNRIPCPANGTVLPGTTYGYEAGNPGACAGANYTTTISGVTVVEGVVPVRTLNLPDEFMYDGWGEKIGYAVTTTMTGTNAFLNYGDGANCGLLTVYGPGGASGGIIRSSNAAYVLISYGPNGHGGFFSNNPVTRVNASSNNADEWMNCHCGSTGADTGYHGTYVQQDPTVTTSHAGDYTYNFDDIVRYKERWEMHNYGDEVNTGGNLTCPSSKGGKATNVGASDFPGFSVAVGDVNGDGIPDLVIGAPASGNGSAGAVYVVFGQLNGFQSPISLPSLNGTNGFVINGITVNDQTGFSVAVGDVNGDGIGDIIIGANAASPNGHTGAGSVFVVYGQSSGWASSFNLSSLNGANGFRINGVTNYAYAGSSVAAGDVNGDGKADIIIGAPYAYTSPSPGTGSVYVVYGSTSLTSTPYDLTSSGALINGTNGFQINGITNKSLTGFAVAAGDFNGDGIADILIGAPSWNTNNMIGNVYALYGHKSPWINPFNLSALDGNNGFVITGNAANDLFGSALAIGDINGDGIGDIIIGAPTVGTGGAVYAGFGKTAKWNRVNGFSGLTGTNGFRLTGISAADQFGYSVAVGDINGDGVGDLIVGARGRQANGQSLSGATYVIFGNNAWLANSTVSVNGTNGFELDGAVPLTLSGTAVAAGDINGDGRTDVIVGSPYSEPEGVYLYFGQRTSGAWTNPVLLSGF